MCLKPLLEFREEAGQRFRLGAEHGVCEVARRCALHRFRPGWIGRDHGADLAELSARCHGKADRIDHSDEGYRVYDYKSGLPPSQSEIRRADKQLSLMALILTKGGFGDRSAAGHDESPLR